ncbi:hypothetical protein KL86PLE_130515 [uncultured Pleomorphomonas sp.]|uniref:Uncharacterized protein n=1 Tax=uncultured Pleomorphomonas sp. TaxID=442121 RepID=A0A212KXN3_9HYPH|nr:hypothetical protein [uncultured Pleomorphomonas sp.]SCM70055.1 hypothetical protein KL86PLE_10020 [uncultured Pleomorphomonas sp.]SCM75114.1 hypothetical protein KL86PLE_130515 [uncultured Pleomorphomonas sp.]
MKQLTARAFDAMTDRAEPGAILWGAKAISAFLGCSEDFVRDRLSKEKGTPIKKVGGRYCAIVGDLVDWIRKGT